MKRLRKVIFWCHLPLGAAAGIVILIMCVTGVLLAYEKQITSWADTSGYRSAPPESETRHLPIETLIAKARKARDGNPTAVTLKADTAAPAEVAFGRETTLFVNPYSGQVLGEGSHRVRSFFRTVTDWHRWLGAKGDNRNDTVATCYTQRHFTTADRVTGLPCHQSTTTICDLWILAK